jgi:Aldehyde oxidase and xanthine dehydrogenase, a/b hammerhead domain
MHNIGHPYVGRSLLRREDRRLLTGQGQFIADLVLPRMLHAVLVRSPVAHARIRAINLSRTSTAPGVVLALNGIDLLQLLPPVPEGQISMPSKWTSVIQHKFLNPQQPLLAHDKGRDRGCERKGSAGRTSRCSFMGENRSRETVSSRRKGSGVPIRGRERAIGASTA